MDEVLSLGEWIRQMEEIPSFKKMTAVKGNRIIFRPKNAMQTAWAKAFSVFLKKQKVETIVL